MDREVVIHRMTERFQESPDAKFPRQTLIL